MLFITSCILVERYEDLEEHLPSTYLTNGIDIFLWNVGNRLPDNTVSEHRRAP